MREGLSQVGDIWDAMQVTFLPWDALCERYSLLPEEQQCYINLVASIPHEWIRILTTRRDTTRRSEIMGVFLQPDDELRSTGDS